MNLVTTLSTLSTLALLVTTTLSSPLPLVREVNELHREVLELRSSLRSAAPLKEAIAMTAAAMPVREVLPPPPEPDVHLLLQDVDNGAVTFPLPPLLLRVEQVYLDARAPLDRLTGALSYSPSPHGDVTWLCRDAETGECPLVLALSSASSEAVEVPTLMTLNAIEAESSSLYLLLCPPRVNPSMAPVWKPEEEETGLAAAVCEGNVTLSLKVDRDPNAPPATTYMAKLLHDALEGAKRVTLILNEDAGHRVWTPI